MTMAAPSTVLLFWVGVWVLLCSEASPTTTAQEGPFPLCSIDKIPNADPFVGALAHLVWNLLNAGPVLVREPGKISCYTNVYQGDAGTATAYGSVSCNVPDAGSCATCLDDALHAISDGCLNSYGAQITLKDCFMRFEAYKYCD